MRLTLIEQHDDYRGRRESAWYRTDDGRFDVLGDDLNCTDAAARAAGAGPVWSWRPARQTRAYSNDQHAFTSKAACLADLTRHIHATLTTPPAIVTCRCGQKNRLPVPLSPTAVVKCGRCGSAFILVEGGPR